MTNHIKEIIYNMAIEEHNIWILHNQELMPLYEPDQERLDKVAITGENFKQVTKDLDKPYEETKEEYNPTGEIKTVKCPECGNEIQMAEGCFICLKCGYSGCS